MTFSPQSPVGSTRWLPVYNGSAYAVPAYGVMVITGGDEDNQCFTIDRPTANSQVNVLVNGPTSIPPSSFGQGHRTEPMQVLYETSDGTPAVGEDWGTKSGSWKLHKTQAGEAHSGFRPQGLNDGDTTFTAFLGPGYGGADGFLAKITGNAGTSPKKYSWEEYDVATDGTLSALSGGRSGTTTEDYAVERDNETTPTNTYVWMHLSPAGQYWFDYQVLTASTVSVKESDGAPVVTASVISFTGNTATSGFNVTDSGGGVATIGLNSAGTAQYGIVTTASQTFAGGKVFSQQTGMYRGSGDWQLVLFEPGGGSDVSGRGRIKVLESGSNATMTLRVYQTVSDNKYLEIELISLESDGCPFVIRYAGSAATANICPKIRLVDSDGDAFDGLTTTVDYDKAGGGTGTLTFTGGILTGST